MRKSYLGSEVKRQENTSSTNYNKSAVTELGGHKSFDVYKSLAFRIFLNCSYVDKFVSDKSIFNNDASLKR